MLKRSRKSGSGVLDSIINNLPVELHIPGYKFCGTGTKLAKGLERDDVGINALDKACKEYDMAYSREKNLKQGHKADQILSEKAVERFKLSNASIGEKAAALAVATAMKAKVKLQMGCGNKKTKKRKSKRKVKFRKVGGSLAFKDVINQARVALTGKNVKNLKDAIKVALKAVNKGRRRRNILKPLE